MINIEKKNYIQKKKKYLQNKNKYVQKKESSWGGGGG